MFYFIVLTTLLPSTTSKKVWRCLSPDGNSDLAIDPIKFCDGVVDCDNAADEKGCCKYICILLHRMSYMQV